ncbi:unnamed protein product [Coccothraustes coccothraustes]
MCAAPVGARQSRSGRSAPPGARVALESGCKHSGVLGPFRWAARRAAHRAWERNGHAGGCRAARRCRAAIPAGARRHGSSRRSRLTARGTVRYAASEN